MMIHRLRGYGRKQDLAALSLMPQHLLLSQSCAVMDVLLMWYPRAPRDYGDLGGLLKSCPLSSVLQARILSHTSTWQAPPSLQSCFHNMQPLFLIALWVRFYAFLLFLSCFSAFRQSRWLKSEKHLCSPNSWSSLHLFKAQPRTSFPVPLRTTAIIQYIETMEVCVLQAWNDHSTPQSKAFGVMFVQQWMHSF